MATVDIRTAANTYETAITGGTIPLANKKIYVASWAMRLEPYETPLLSTIGIGKAINQDVFYFGRSYQLPHSAAVSGALTNSATTINVVSGQGLRFQVYDVVSIKDYVSGSTRTDESTKEIVWVTAISTDALTVTRAQGSTTGVTHLDGALLQIIGTALPQNTDHVLSPQRRGDQQYNVFQRFSGMAQADDAARHQPTYENETDILLADLAEETKMKKLELEMAIIQGGRQRGQPGSTTTPSMMGGLDTFITSNVTNAGGAALSVYAIEAEIRDLWKAVGENKATKFLMNADTATIFDALLNPYRRATMDTNSANLTWDKIKFRFGVFDIAVSRWIPDGVIYGVDTKNMKVHPFEGMNWHTKDIETGGDYSKKSISGDFSLRLEREHTMFKFWNFDTNLDNYPRQEYF
jgi:hypothetical protein